MSFTVKATLMPTTSSSRRTGYRSLAIVHITNHLHRRLQLARQRVAQQCRTDQPARLLPHQHHLAQPRRRSEDASRQVMPRSLRLSLRRVRHTPPGRMSLLRRRSVVEEDRSDRTSASKHMRSANCAHVFDASSSRRPATKVNHVVAAVRVTPGYGKYHARVWTSRTLPTS